MIQGYLIYFIVLIAGLWIASLVITGDIFSPVSVFCLMFLFSSFCALYSTNKWNFAMSIDTFQALTYGVLSFFIPSVLFHVVMIKKRDYYLVEDEKSVEEDSYSPECRLVEVSSNKAFLIVLIFFVCTAVYFFFLTRAVGRVELSRIASVYRNSMISGVGNQISFVGRLMMIIIRAIANVLVCIIINNFFATRSFGNHSFILFFCCSAYVLLTLLSGERTSAIRFVGVMVLSFSIFWQRNSYYRRLVNIKYIILSVLGALVLLYAFSAIRFFVGRSSQLDIFDYVSMYAGGPIYSFDRFINSYIRPTFSGTKTFVGLYNNFARLGFGDLLSINRDTITIQNLNIYIGNVYTCFYDYYSDYGPIGMVLLVCCYSCIINGMYYRAKFAEDRTLLKTIEYTFFATTLFFVSFTEQFFTSYVTLSTIESLIIIKIVYCFFVSRSVGFLRYAISKD